MPRNRAELICGSAKRVKSTVHLSQESLELTQTPSTGLRHPSLKEGAGKRCSECGVDPQSQRRCTPAKAFNVPNICNSSDNLAKKSASPSHVSQWGKGLNEQLKIRRVPGSRQIVIMMYKHYRKCQASKNAREDKRTKTFVCFLYFFEIPAGDTLPGYGTAAARAATPIPSSVCSISVCPYDCLAASVCDF